MKHTLLTGSSVALLVTILSACGPIKKPLASTTSPLQAQKANACAFDDEELSFNKETDQDCFSDPDSKKNDKEYAIDVSFDRAVKFEADAGKKCYQKRFMEVAALRVQKFLNDESSSNEKQTLKIGACEFTADVFGYKKEAFKEFKIKNEINHYVIGTSNYARSCNQNVKTDASQTVDMNITTSEYESTTGKNEAELKKLFFGGEFKTIEEVSNADEAAHPIDAALLQRIAIDAFIICRDWK